MTNLQSMIQKQAEQPQAGAGDALRDAVARANQNTNPGAGAGNESTTTSGTSSTATPIVYSQVELNRKLQAFGEDEKERRKTGSLSIVLKGLAKTPNNYAIAIELYGKNHEFQVIDDIARKANGMEEGAKFPLKVPQKMRDMIDGYQVQFMQANKTLAEPEFISKDALGEWIRKNALIRIGTEEKGVKIKERNTLAAKPYTVSHWGIDVEHGSDDLIPTYEQDGDAKSKRTLNLDTGDKVFKDANSSELKIKTSVELPKYRRIKKFEEKLGPLKVKTVGPPTTPFEVDEALRSLAKIELAEEQMGQVKAD